MKNYNTLDKIILYVTFPLIVDSLITPILTGGKTLHETLGINLPEIVENMEKALMVLGFTYTLFRPFYKNRRNPIKSNRNDFNSIVDPLDKIDWSADGGLDTKDYIMDSEPMTREELERFIKSY